MTETNVYDLGAYKLAKAAGEDGHMPAGGPRVFAEAVAATSGVLTREALDKGFQAVVREDADRRLVQV